MVTTVVALFAVEDGVYVAHVGDSRSYRLREGKLEQLTEDHSLLNDYKKSRALTPEEILAFPHKNVIVRALGMREAVEVDLRRVAVAQGDTFLLCSDGLSGMVPDERIAEIVRLHSRDLRGAAQALVDAANDGGGQDNVTCVLVQHFAS